MHKIWSVIGLFALALGNAEASTGSPPSPGVVTQLTINPLTGTGHLYLDALPNGNFYETFRHCTAPEVVTSTNPAGAVCTADGYLFDNGAGSLTLSWGPNTVFSYSGGLFTFGVPAILITGSTAITQANGDTSNDVATDKFVMSQGFGTSTVTQATNTSWTPTITAATPGTQSIAYTTQTGTSYRTGSNVCISFTMSFTPTWGTAAGNVSITGVPYAGGGTNLVWVINAANPISAFTWPGSGTILQYNLASGSTSLGIIGLKSGSSASLGNINAFTSGTAYTLSGSGCYATTTQ